MRVGVNTYGLGSLFETDFEGTLERLRKIGFDFIEPCVLFEDALSIPEERMREHLRKLGISDAGIWSSKEAGEKIEQVRNKGFDVTGAHVMLSPMLGCSMEKALSGMREVGRNTGLCYYAYSPQKSKISDASSDIPDLKMAISELAEDNIDFLFHNHFNELADDGDDTVFEYYIREVSGLKIEPDAGWIEFAGKDSLEIIRNYGSKISVLHLKDFVENADKKAGADRFAAVGEGIIPLKEIIREAKGLNLIDPGIVIDQDASPNDLLEDLRRGLENIKKYL